MPRTVLVKEKRYEGKYVAMKSFTNHQVVASGHDPQEVMKAAVRKGAKHPVIVFVPKGNITQIF